MFARDCAANGESCACRLVGRLDRDTSGAVVIAKNARAAAVLMGHVEKQYIALVTGMPNPKHGVIDAPIGQPDRKNPRRMIVANGKPAVTEYETQTVSYTHLRAHETGRNLVCRLLLEKKKTKKRK